MKTAEQWIAEYKAERTKYLQGEIPDEKRELKWLNGDLLRKVQQDAYEAGMLAATKAHPKAR